MRRYTFAVDIDGTITENGAGRIHLDALGALRRLCTADHRVIFVTGRSSVEGFLLAVFGGTTRMAVGENGGCITTGTNEHTMLGDRAVCRAALDVLRGRIGGIREKDVFPRMTEVVLERTFDIDEARRIASEENLGVSISDSMYAYHVNPAGIDKGAGFREVMDRISISREDVIAIGDSATDVPLFEEAGISVALGNSSDAVRSSATMTTAAGSGDGVLEALDRIVPELSGA